MTSTGCERVENCGLSSHPNENKSSMDEEVESRKEVSRVLSEVAESNDNPGPYRKKLCPWSGVRPEAATAGTVFSYPADLDR